MLVLPSSSTGQAVTLAPGDALPRSAIHAALGGQTQSGISPAPNSKLVFAFSDPTSGLKHGYADRWQPDGHFHYVGEGQSGDQTMTRGNLRLRDQQKNNTPLHVFFGHGKGRPVTYQGQFDCVDYYTADAPETGGGPLRNVFVFRLRPQSGALIPPEAIAPAGQAVGSILPSHTTVTEVDVEQHLTERTVFEPGREPIESERREARLIQSYRAFLSALGYQTTRHRIRPAGEPQPIITDLFDLSRDILIEAKGSCTREAIRMAIGQLLDYSRHLKTKRLAVLVPSTLRDDLRDMLRGLGIGIIEQTDDGFREELVFS